MVAIAQLVRPVCRQAGRRKLCITFIIIKSKNLNKYYTGITGDIDRRITEHNQKLSNTKTTKNITDFEIVFLTIVNDRITARLTEIYLKSGIGREFRKSLT